MHFNLRRSKDEESKQVQQSEKLLFVVDIGDILDSLLGKHVFFFFSVDNMSWLQSFGLRSNFIHIPT